MGFNWLDPNSDESTWIVLLLVVAVYFYTRTRAARQLNSRVATIQTIQASRAAAYRQLRSLAATTPGATLPIPVLQQQPTTLRQLKPPNGRVIHPAVARTLSPYVSARVTHIVTTTHPSTHARAIATLTPQELLQELITTCQERIVTANDTYTKYSDTEYLLNAIEVIATSLNFINASGSVSSSMLVAATAIGGKFVALLLNPFLISIILSMVGLFRSTLAYGRLSVLWQQHANYLTTLISFIQAELADPSQTDAQLMTFYLAKVEELNQKTDALAIEDGWS